MTTTYRLVECNTKPSINMPAFVMIGGELANKHCILMRNDGQGEYAHDVLETSAKYLKADAIVWLQRHMSKAIAQAVFAARQRPQA